MKDHEKVCYEKDMSGLSGKVEKVVFPESIEEVQEVVSSGRDVVIRGGGSNLVGGCVPSKSGSIILDMRKMNKVLDFDPKKGSVWVEAGVTIKELNEKLKQISFEFPIFLNEISTIGGMVAMNCIGDMSMKYGDTKEWVEEVEFVNGRGEKVKIGKADLSDVCGMEGITGVITKVKLKIIPLIKKSASVFQSEDIEEIWSIARRLKLDNEIIMLKLFCPEISKILGFSEKYHMIIVFDSNRGKIYGREFTELFKKIRKSSCFLYSKEYYDKEDVKFYFDKLKEFIDFLESVDVVYSCELGVGIVDAFFKESQEDLKKQVVEKIKRLGGKDGRQGIGLLRKYLLESMDIKIIKRIKKRYDPFYKLNKEKVLDFVEKGIDDEFVDEKKMADKIVSEVKDGERPVGEFKISRAEHDAEEKMEEFIKEVESEEEKEVKKRLLDAGQKQKSFSSVSSNLKISELFDDYEKTFNSELDDDRKEKVEKFAQEVSREIIKKEEENINKKEKELIEGDRGDEYGRVSGVGVEKEEISEGEVGKVRIDDNLDRLPASELRGKVSESEKSLIDSVMFGGSGVKSEKKEDEKDERAE